MPGGRYRPVAPMGGPKPLLWLAWACAAAAILYVIGAPFWATEYPMMTDFPFHAASSSIFRHYLDAGWHFREQFVFQLLTVPYATFYVLSALLMLVLPPVIASKVAAALLLALLPVGLMVLCWGLNKSPLLGLWGLVPVWGVVTHWGFINYLAGLGLFAMALGLSLRIAERSSPRLHALLATVLVLLFFTDVFRFPMMVTILFILALVMNRRVDSVRPVVITAGIAAGLFVAWWWTLPNPMATATGWVRSPDWGRLTEVGRYAFDIYVDDGDTLMFRRVGLLFGFTAVVLLIVAVLRLRSWPSGGWVAPAHAVVAIAILLFVALYLTLPMEKGIWWYVFPREVTGALFLLPALLPNLPRKTWASLGFVVWTAVAIAPLAEFVAEAHREFGTTTVHFREIVRELPKAPKLLYLVYDHEGSRAQSSPYVHLPAYAQAERGGWLSYHFAQFEHSPLRYRDASDPEAEIPPKTPVRWEWSPQLFQLDAHGAFFDWFLVRRASSPDELFAADPSIARVAHFENWWLYHRRGGSTGPAPERP
jgi:hypothetical protein